MSTELKNAVTVTEVVSGAPFTDTDMAKLYKGLGVLNVSIQNLSKASILNKGAAADIVLNAARDLLANQNFAIHLLFNDITRLNAEIGRISNIGVIKNG